MNIQYPFFARLAYTDATAGLVCLLVHGAGCLHGAVFASESEHTFADTFSSSARPMAAAFVGTVLSVTTGPVVAFLAAAIFFRGTHQSGRPWVALLTSQSNETANADAGTVVSAGATSRTLLHLASLATS